MPVTDEQLSGLRVALLGNLDEATFWSTEWEYHGAWSANGANVSGYIEQDSGAWDRLISDVDTGRFDLVQWTSTRQFAERAGEARQWQLAATCQRRNVPLIAIHLDQYLSLPERVERVRTGAYFRAVTVAFTVDGGHDELWAELGVNHKWLLPAISERWIGPGTPQAKWKSDIAFVGSWQGGYHPEFAHRHELVAHLQQRWGDRVRFWPKHNQPRIVGRDLNDLYWSTRVVVGDAFHEPGSGGQPLLCTGSDRSPETLGRGGLLVTPAVEGWNAGLDDPFRLPGCRTWEMWNWEALDEQINRTLDLSEADALAERAEAIDCITAWHTYTTRVRQVVDTLRTDGLL
jgi:hypothetical protein